MVKCEYCETEGMKVCPDCMPDMQTIIRISKMLNDTLHRPLSQEDTQTLEFIRVWKAANKAVGKSLTPDKVEALKELEVTQ